MPPPAAKLGLGGHEALPATRTTVRTTRRPSRASAATPSAGRAAPASAPATPEFAGASGTDRLRAGTDRLTAGTDRLRAGDRRAAPTEDRVLVVGCGALARELVALTANLSGIDVACLPPELHNRPERIPGRVRDRIAQGRREGYERFFVAYADCGTGGLLDPVLAAEGAERLAGAHCYEFFAGRTDFARLADEEPATFWLTDFLARNFERLVIRGLGIDRHPELEAMYFGNYRRVVYLSQTDDPDLLAMARRAADRLGLAFEHRHTGLGELATSIRALRVVGGSNGPDSRPASTSDQGGTREGRIKASKPPETAESVAPVRGASRTGTPPARRVASERGARIPSATPKATATGHRPSAAASR